MKTFGIEEVCVDSLLSSRLKTVQSAQLSSREIPAAYVSDDYASNFNLLSKNKIHVPRVGTHQKRPIGYVSIEGAQILQEYS